MNFSLQQQLLAGSHYSMPSEKRAWAYLCSCGEFVNPRLIPRATIVKYSKVDYYKRLR